MKSNTKDRERDRERKKKKRRKLSFDTNKKCLGPPKKWLSPFLRHVCPSRGVPPVIPLLRDDAVILIRSLRARLKLGRLKGLLAEYPPPQRPRATTFTFTGGDFLCSFYHFMHVAMSIMLRTCQLFLHCVIRISAFALFDALYWMFVTPCRRARLHPSLMTPRRTARIAPRASNPPLSLCVRQTPLSAGLLHPASSPSTVSSRTPQELLTSAQGVGWKDFAKCRQKDRSAKSAATAASPTRFKSWRRGATCSATAPGAWRRPSGTATAPARTTTRTSSPRSGSSSTPSTTTPGMPGFAPRSPLFCGGNSGIYGELRWGA